MERSGRLGSTNADAYTARIVERSCVALSIRCPGSAGSRGQRQPASPHRHHRPAPALGSTRPSVLVRFVGRFILHLCPKLLIFLESIALNLLAHPACEASASVSHRPASLRCPPRRPTVHWRVGGRRG